MSTPTGTSATANWTNSCRQMFLPLAIYVVFDDTASAFTVNLATNVSPTSMTFSNSANNYTIGSAGGYTLGGGSLTLAGTNTTVTLNTTNTFGGPITIGGSNEVLVIGGAGRLGGGNYGGGIINNGAFSYNSPASQTLSGVISGSGGITDNSTNKLTLSAANSFTGNIVINSGILSDTMVKMATGTRHERVGQSIDARTDGHHQHQRHPFVRRGQYFGDGVPSLNARLHHQLERHSAWHHRRQQHDRPGHAQWRHVAGEASAGYSGYFGPFGFGGDITVGGSSPSYISSTRLRPTLTSTWSYPTPFPTGLSTWRMSRATTIQCGFVCVGATG